MGDGRFHPPGTNLGGASGDALAGRIALWTRRKALARVDFYRVMRGVEHLDDFDAGPESPDEIGAFGTLIADSEGVPVTLEIVAMRRQDGEEIAVRSIALRCVPTPAPAALAPLSERAVTDVMQGYVALQKSTTEMVSGVTAALRTVGELTAKIIADAAARDVSQRAQLDEMTDLLRDALDTARAAKAAAVPQSRAERLERLIVEMVGSKVEKFAVGILTDTDDSEPTDEAADEAPKVVQ